jgi:hypothetical protein
MRTWCVALTLAACGGGGYAGDDDFDTVNCAEITDDDEFVIGLSKTGAGGAFTFTITAGNPAPPIRGDNSWVVELSTATEPIEDAAITVTPFMPAHQHGAGKAVDVTPAGVGQYELAPVNLWMPGVWETTVSATAGAVTDSVVFRFCIPS